ncbi:MAG TPA: 3-dehydroquinate synthase, partial [Rhodanobacteraceae bacterium]|nr:3-dehydroquinate synthase [Rhodanobacteraceae bacterium]
FGHAIETEAGYGTLLHGEAVAMGMALAARLSVRLGMSDETDTRRLHGLLDRFGLPTAPPKHLQADALIARMRLDKKNRGGALRLILWRGIGRVERADSVGDTEILHILSGAKAGIGGG